MRARAQLPVAASDVPGLHQHIPSVGLGQLKPEEGDYELRDLFVTGRSSGSEIQDIGSLSMQKVVEQEHKNVISNTRSSPCFTFL